MTREEVKERAFKVLKETGPVGDTIEESMSLTNDLELDSLDRLELLIAIEKEFNIELDTETFTDKDKISEVIDYITEVVNR